MMSIPGSGISKLNNSGRSMLRRESKLIGLGGIGKEPGSATSFTRFKRKVKKSESEQQREITNKKYENLCYNATYRVQENKEKEIDKKK